MAQFATRAELSWMRDLRADPEAGQHSPNRTSRQVKSGHYVPVRPDPLPAPRLVIYSPVMAAELGISEEACRSEEFLRFFSGDIDAVPGFESWATPYALSIMGQQQYHNCPFKNGNGYGDGRAVSIGEIVTPSGRRWEMQLKGGGKTPFCRGADGRAVLRSSVREFLASEAMHHLGVSTTRALSLIVSKSETAERPWYSGKENTSMDDSRLSEVPPEMRQMFRQMLQQQKGEPDTMMKRPCAITCRVAPSFTRIGHLDLFARRVAKAGATAQQREEHEMMVRHAFDREYPEILPRAPLAERALAVFDAAVERIATMAAGWLRVGFCQGNFNCDNCLIAGRTMDYGPFGFIDKYDPGFAKWTGSGEHFAFANQPQAALANIGTFATSLEPLFDSAGKQALQARLKAAAGVVQSITDGMWCSKLGFDKGSENGSTLFCTLEELMRKSDVDYTLLFRQLAQVPAVATCTGGQEDVADGSKLLEPLSVAFYKDASGALKEEWVAWLRDWLKALAAEGAIAGATERMNHVNPKYILREYMLGDAYKAAEADNYGLVHELYQLIRSPYDEQPALEAKYYCRAPAAALTAPGISVMT